MKCAYLILAHNNPRHLQRLIESLTSPGARFFIHLDLKADAARFRHLESDRVAFSKKRIDCAWGNISLVDATLTIAELALNDADRFDYHVLLSGACYPIKSTTYIERFLTEQAGREFIETIEMPNAEYGKAIERLSKYYIAREKPFARWKWKFQSLLHAILPARDFRRAFGTLVPVAGSQWWALTHAALEHACRFVREHGDLYRFCKHVDCPDELLFQTALWNSSFRESISHSLTFTHWQPAKMGPEIIDERLVDRFRAARVLDSESNNSPHEKREVVFARKFTDASAEIVGLIDTFRAAGGPDAATRGLGSPDDAVSIRASN